jgi:hypothetical protein
VRVLLLQLDGALPNLAVMRLAAHHRSLGDGVEVRRAPTPGAVGRGLFDRRPDEVYASLIFERTRPVAEAVRRVYPGAVLGGTGWDVARTLADAGIPPRTRCPTRRAGRLLGRTPLTVGFQRWVVAGYDKRVPWPEWKAAHCQPRELGHRGRLPLPLFDAAPLDPPPPGAASWTGDAVSRGTRQGRSFPARLLAGHGT